MTNASPDSTRQGKVAALVLDSETLVALWCNDAYLQLLHGNGTASTSIIGQSYGDFAPHMASSREPVFREVARTGESQSGADYRFDLSRGSGALRWEIHRPVPGLLLALIDVE
jgi:hypothetical protein